MAAVLCEQELRLVCMFSSSCSCCCSGAFCCSSRSAGAAWGCSCYPEVGMLAISAASFVVIKAAALCALMANKGGGG